MLSVIIIPAVQTGHSYGAIIGQLLALGFMVMFVLVLWGARSLEKYFERRQKERGRNNA